MKKKLNENKAFLILAPMIALAGIGAIQYFLYDAYINWTMWKYGLMVAGMGACFAVFMLWVGVACRKGENSAKRCALSTIFGTLIFVGLFVGVMFLINNVLSLGNKTAFVISVVIMDLGIMFMFGLGVKGTADRGKLKGVVATICAFALVVVIAVSGAFAYFVMYGENSTPNYFAGVVQNFNINGGISDHGKEKVKVIILAGQSNASGVCRAEYLAKNVSGEKYTEYLEGFANVQINYFTENGNNASYGFTNARLGEGCGNTFFGPELGMAEYLADAYADETVFIIKYAWGGSNLYEQWKAPKNGETAGPLYTACINFVTTSMEYLLDNNYDATIGAMCWMQGESDSDDAHAPVYGENLSAMVNSMRNDLAKYIADDGMQFIDAGISDSEYWVNYKIINKEKKELETTLENYVYIDTISAGLEYKNEPAGAPDLAHYDATSGIKLGHLFGEQIVKRYSK